MASVFVVTCGIYSDRHIVGIYSTRELAQRRVDLEFDANDIDEWELDGNRSIDELGLQAYRVFFDNGVVSYVCRRSIGHALDEGNKKWERDVTGGLSLYQYPTVLARDEEHARKIAADEYARERAKEAGV